MARGKNRGEYVRSRKRRHRRTIENSQNKESRRAQVAKRSEQSLSASSSLRLQEQVQHMGKYTKLPIGNLPARNSTVPLNRRA